MSEVVPTIQASGAQLDARPTGDQDVVGSQHFYELFFTIIHSLPLIQEGQLSVSGDKMCPSTG